MKKMKKLLVFGLSLVMALTFFTACGGSGGSGDSDADTDQTYDLRLGTIVNEEHTLTLSAQRYADAVKEATDGHVNITVYPSSQLGDYINVYDELSMGSIDLAWQTIPDTYDKRNNLGMTPYLVTDYDGIRELYGNKDSWFFKTLAEVNAEKGVTLLGIAPNGFMGVGAEKLGNLDTVFDFNTPQDALIRSASIDTLIAQVETMGYRVTTIAYADLYSSLQTGVADGWYGGSAISNIQGFKDVIKYFVDYRSVNEPMGMLMSTKTLESLPQEYQDIMIDLAVEENAKVIDDVEKADGEALKALEEYGIEIIEPTDEQLDEMATIMREKVYPLFADDFGEELMNEINNWVESH